jgi:hypothetical protein
MVIEYLKFAISSLDNSGAPVHNALLPLNATQEQDNEELLLKFFSYDSNP